MFCTLQHNLTITIIGLTQTLYIHIKDNGIARNSYNALKSDLKNLARLRRLQIYSQTQQ